MPAPIDALAIVQALSPVVEEFERLGIPYHIGGSLASTQYGQPRVTQDVDVVADVQPQHVLILVRRLQADYYIDAGMIREAIRRRSSFNLLYTPTMFKVDVFLPKHTPLAWQQQQRARPAMLAPGTRPFLCASPEDMILAKLDWWQQGGGASARQWNDVLEIMRRQQANLDLPYLRQSAPQLSVAADLERALTEAGLQPP